MGQKTHPIGIRMGISQESPSRWYAEKGRYAFFLKEDKYIRDLARKICAQGIISKVEIERRGIGVRLCVFAAHVKIVIGPNGKSLKNLRHELTRKCRRLRRDFFRMDVSQQIIVDANKLEIQVFVHRIHQPETDARYVADSIVTALEGRTLVRRVLSITKEQVLSSGKVRGLRLQVAGRLNGAEIARRERVLDGRIPLHTISEALDYAHITAQTTYGLLGVKVWILI